MKALTEIIIDKRRIKNNGTYPIKLRVTLVKEQEYYPTGYSLTEDDFIKIKSGKGKGDLKSIAIKLQAMEKRATDIIEELGDAFTYGNFDKLYVQNRALRDSLESAFNDYIATIEPSRIGTIEVYERARNSFLKYDPKAKIADISVRFLQSYETWMRDADNSPTTTGIYCRHLRSVLKGLIADGRMSEINYPFGSAKEKKFEIPTSRNKKKALGIDIIGKIYNYPSATGSVQEMCRDYFLFTYFANGMNFADFCRLKWKHLEAGKITFVREKTVRTKKVVENIELQVIPEMQDIIEKWGTKAISKEAFIFPHLTNSMTAQEMYNKVGNLVWLVNKHIKVIAKDLGISENPTTYFARHSFATILKNSGAPVAMISQALGHSSMATTQNYLDSFESDQLQDAKSVLTSFKNKAASE